MAKNVLGDSKFSRFTKLNSDETSSLSPLVTLEVETKGACALQCHQDASCKVIAVGPATKFGVSCSLYSKYREIEGHIIYTDNTYFAKVASDCSDEPGYNGLMKISPPGFNGAPVTVWCSFGWTYIQRRTGPELNFDRTWDEYRAGFGFNQGDHWVGNELVHAITYGKSYRLKVRLDSYNNNTYYITYDDFYLESEDQNYALNLDPNTFVGSIGDSFAPNVGQPFTTLDRNNAGNSCVGTALGGWWYIGCGYVMLTARYPDDPYCASIPLKCFKYSGITNNNCDTGCLLRGSVMMIKPV
ncbi:angiopoietin-related protein 1-like [Lingula anatina]|uniref:Angiopoietin-related protein 1-like n=1 Tax=Lingula anatina TaxID=7574 RepID=A0A1S3J372_LINAN|nr:angiopoietin-related protein 1-like [Lingula anatina]|eukprot:XP_013404862.1 angiopoietin-related protein 1-like [Lingula anatina]